MLYCQLTKIHAIGAAQLAECALWRCSNSSPSPVRFRTDRRSLDGMPSATRMAPPPPVDFSPKLHCGSKARVMSLWHAGSTGKRACDPIGVCRTHAMTSPANGGDTTLTTRGRQQERLRAVLMAECGHGLSACLPTPLETPPKVSAMSAPLVPSALRRPSFNRPQVAAGKHHLALPSKAPRRALRPARRGTNNAIRRPQLTTTAASTSKQVAPVRNMLRRSWATASTKHDRPWTT
jgi:hypothetical protein